MKGRLTSFQRFGSMVGVQGSALNKWTRGAEVRRDMDKNVDNSDGKGIYNLTITNDNHLNYSVSDADMGEEVYGCITFGYTKTSPNIEYSSNIAIKNRGERKDYEDHFSESGREWTGGDKKVQVESACIPQENVPLVANSKFEIKYWDNGDEKLVEVPKGAGFTSGALVRPIAFSEKALEPPDGSIVFDGYLNALYACKLSAVPIKTAHAILNRCKEISLTGSVDFNLTRTNKKCDGPNSSTMTWTSESGPNGCPPGKCEDTSGSITISCISKQQTTKLKLSGDIDMTAYRYKQLSDIWSEPKPLDLSGNYFFGNFEDGAFLRKISSSYCDSIIDSIPVALPNPTIETIAELEKQTKLSSGCLVYPETNASILLAKQEENLKTSDDLGLDNCSESRTSYNLTDYPYDGYYYAGVSSGYFGYAGGTKTVDFGICPLFVSGPSLRCGFIGSGWDYSSIGGSGPEDISTSDDCFPQYQNFPNWKMDWKSTGIKKTIESGACELGLNGLGRYDRSYSSGCECDSSCEDCQNNYGKLDLSCNCTPLCATGNASVPCSKGEFPPGCDGSYGFSLKIGKHVGVGDEDYPTLYNVAPVPLSAKLDTKTEDLTLLWYGFVSDQSGVYSNTDMEFPLVLNKESADNLFQNTNNSIHRFESKEVGTLTIKCDDWTTDVPIWTMFRIAKENTCTGNIYSGGGGNNILVRTVTGAPPTYCNGCGGTHERCCSSQGCGGKQGDGECCVSEVCGIADPCGYAYTTTNVGKECDGNKSPPSCSDPCEDSNGEDCGCCGCEFDTDLYCDVICPPFNTCKPYVLEEDFKILGCYGDAHEEDEYKAEVNLTLEFKLFTEME